MWVEIVTFMATYSNVTTNEKRGKVFENKDRECV
jgi:hypothetical protein